MRGRLSTGRLGSVTLLLQKLCWVNPTTEFGRSFCLDLFIYLFILLGLGGQGGGGSVSPQVT